MRICFDCVRTFRVGIIRCAGNAGCVGSIPVGIKVWKVTSEEHQLLMVSF